MTLSRFTLTSPPETVCILRLSALGDITHTLPVLRTLQSHWPDTRLSWVIGKTEYELVRDIEGVEFIIFDKSRGFSAYADIRRQLKGKKFDILLHMQMSIRASITSLLIPANIKLGFDRERAKDMQWLFSNHKIQPASTRQHVVDSFLEFPGYFGLEAVMQWDLPVSPAARDSVSHKLKTDSKILVINPCAMAKSRNWRDWTIEGYANAADDAASRLGLSVVLTGGPTDREKAMAEAIVALCHHKPTNLVGQTSIAELVAILAMAEIVIAPDTGPAHIANALGTPVIGLYAATNPDRARPYRYKDYVINQYPQALKKYYGLEVEDAAWGKRVQNSECMAMISAESVSRMIDKILSTQK